ncbi:3-hydroxyacyl-CoA dehydrogenase NAD-binding domain-containing protein [Ruegeria sp. R14_0]|uniref:3-hydroxyacyl-CoA dehydrogenase NAD-binding domain-containing protein n=1 Tax=Ruegeria sp. R14_0 TaxID=2821100 RepID=UPI001ADCF525|nr:3-hydroxyacyl-CoA dehydrogenase NAD-binding domain-containing protein [Ruegeria sp. R14_0]MBO9446723.1 enoyl-CoA hydratase/isomerase family protein [Ruegeria sp. R14_0]
MTVTTTTKHGAIAVIRVDNPPVNAISQAVRQGLEDAVSAIEADTEVKAAVILCAGRTFMAGADISELGKPPLPPHLNDLTDTIERCSKPLVAAIHGQALGGGLEIALSCSHRVAVPGTRFGLPEVNLGFVPGAGGTQRLPRLIGVEPALNMAVEGKPVGTEAALSTGLIDQIVDDLEPDAIEFARKIVAQGQTARKLNQAIAPDSFSHDLFDQWRAKCAKRKRGLDAPLAVIDAIEAATGTDVDAGKATERALSLKLRKSPQSKALRHIFAAERASAKIEGVDPSVARQIVSVGVIGAGTMGAGIAQFFATNGISVTLVEISAEAAATGIDRIRENLSQSVKRGKLTQGRAAEILPLVHPTTDYADLADVDLVIEAAVELLEVKKEIFARLDKACKPSAILATNTSYLDVSTIANATDRPDQVAGLHFFSPAHVMKLVEIVRTDQVAPWVLATLAQMMKKLGKTGVIAGNCHGFIGNRMYQSYQKAAGLLLLETGSPEIVDQALRNFGMAMGPFQVLDLSGIDVGYLMRKSLPGDRVHPYAFKVHDALVEAGRKGRKSGAGFYSYSPDGAATDQMVLDLIADTARDYGVTPGKLSEEQIASRCMEALAQEGLAILDEGVAARPGDIDVVFVNGYGFPRHRGGPDFLQRQ